MAAQSTEERWFLRRVASLRFAFILFFTVLSGTGCTTARVREYRLAPTGLASKDAVAVIVMSPFKQKQLEEVESVVTGCLQEAMTGRYSDVRILSPDELRRSAAPNTVTEPKLPDRIMWKRLLRDPAFYDRVVSLGLRYLIVVNTEESTRLTDVEWKGVASLGGPTLEGSWERSALMEGIVVDARNRRVAGKVFAYASGESGAGVTLMTFPTIFLLPYGRTSFPTSVACRGLGEGLAKFLVNESMVRGRIPEPDED